MRFFSLTETQADRWRKTRAKGLSHFIGACIVKWGLPMAAIYWAVILWADRAMDTIGFGAQDKWPLWLIVLPSLVVVCVVGAAVMAVVVWFVAEWQYRKSRPNEAPPFKSTSVLTAMLVIALVVSFTPPLLDRLSDFADARLAAVSARMYAPYERFYDETVLFRRQSRTGMPDPALVPRAQKLLGDSVRFRGDWNYGNAVHYANLYLGRIALERGDVREARTRLLAAGRTPGSPQLDDFGPDMTLADELLEHGESAVVLAYFRECDRFWGNKSKNRLNEWSAAVRAGRKPDFGKRSGHSVIVT